MTDLNALIADIESKHFRTASDTGANWNALFIWNLVRAEAGLDPLTREGLYKKERSEYLLTAGQAFLDGDIEKANRYAAYVNSLDKNWNEKGSRI